MTTRLIILSDHRNPRNPGPGRAPKNHDIRLVGRAEETPVHSSRTCQQPSNNVLRRTDQRPGQLLLLPVRVLVENPREWRQDHHLHHPPTLGPPVRNVRPPLHPGRGTVRLPRINEATRAFLEDPKSPMSLLSQPCFVHHRGLLRGVR